MTLQVAGAFHTPYMEAAEKALAETAAGIRPADPRRIVVSNADGAGVTTGTELLRRLVAQVTAPVRWDLCMRTLVDLGVTGVIELPPAGTLAGLIKREFARGEAPEIVTLNTPADLPAAIDLIARHGMAPSHEPTMAFALAVAAAGGTFVPDPTIDEGATITAGQVIAQITTRQGDIEVTAHGSGVLVEWLAHHDDPINPGQPLARISTTR